MLLHAPLLFSALFFLFLFLFCILYHFLLYYFFFFFFYSFTRSILWFLPRVLLVLPNFSLVLSLFPLILYPNFCSYVEYRSPFPRRCSFISLALVARILKSTIVIVARGGWFGSGFGLETGSFVSGLQRDHKDRTLRKLLK